MGTKMGQQAEARNQEGSGREEQIGIKYNVCMKIHSETHCFASYLKMIN